jgi:ERCC4-type nuclease
MVCADRDPAAISGDGGPIEDLDDGADHPFKDVTMIQSVIIDSREPQWIQGLSFGGVPKAVTMLNAGDLWVACDDNNMLVIERKTPGDFLNTLRGDRLFGQMAAIHAASPWAYLLITGELQRAPDGKVITDRMTGWDWNSIQGALVTVQEMGVRVIQCAGDQDVEAAVTRLACRDRGAVPVIPPRQSRILSESEAIIASLPGIGLERLDAVVNRVGPLDRYGWVALIDLTDDRKNEIPGIGSGTKRNIRRALGLPDGIYLGLDEREDNNGQH